MTPATARASPAAADLTARWTDGVAAEADAPAVITPAGSIDRRTVLQRVHGAARDAAEGGERGERGVRPEDARVWVPWLAGCALGGAVFRFDAGGIAEPPPESDSAPTPADPATPCLAVATSGTSGTPRSLIRDRAAWLRCFAAEESHLGLAPDDRILALGAPAFSLTPYAALRAVHLGAPMAVLDRVTPDRAAAVAGQLDPTVVYGAPPLVMMLARCVRERGLDVRVRRIVTGGARLTPVQHAAIRDAWPNAALTTFHGAAETSYVAMTSDPDPRDPGDLGPLFPGVEADVSEDGRLHVRTPYAAVAVADPDGTRRPLADADGWIRLQDRVALDDGRLRLLGRADARINVGGALHDPADVEAALEDVPWVAEAAVVTVADARRSDVAVAVLVPDGPIPTAAAARRQVHDACAQGAFRTERVIAVDGEVPRTAGGKLDRRALADGLSRGTLPVLEIGR